MLAENFHAGLELVLPVPPTPFTVEKEGQVKWWVQREGRGGWSWEGHTAGEVGVKTKSEHFLSVLFI